MNKKIIALAVAATFSTPVFADSGSIAWYGKAYLNGESVKNDKAAKDSALRVLSNTSRLGIKGSEDLGNGMSGIFQYEVQVDAAGSADNGFGSATRNTGVGLEGNFGKVIVGKWDTPFKTAHNKVELFDNASSFTALNLIGHAGGAGTIVKTGFASAGALPADPAKWTPDDKIPGTANYNTRQKGLVEYWTPKFGAIQGSVSYSPDTAPTTSAIKSNLSLAGTYEQDAISATAAYETRRDVTSSQSDNALRLVGKYTIGDIWVGATYESIKVNTSATANYTQKNAELVGQYKLGLNKFAASYSKAGSSNLGGAHQLTLRYGHDYSTRTEVFAAFTSLKNDSNGNYALTNLYGATALEQTGSEQTVIGAGVIHTF
ncbi:MAG: porin [Gallionella sp.]|nr:porin [Gallionella sp.]